MNRQILRVALSIAAIPSLGACQFISGLHLSHSAARPQPTLAENHYYTNQGQDLLRSGQPGGAAEAFNLALATGEDPAPAYNGLGVAFARMGRPDLAYRFFSKAVTLDPGNGNYASNLDRLVKSPQFTLDMARPAQSGAQPASAAMSVMAKDRGPLGTQASARSAPIADPTSRTGLRRTGPGQVSLTTVQPGTEPFGPNPKGPACLQARRSRQSACAVQSAQRHRPTGSNLGDAGARATPVATLTGPANSLRDTPSKQKVLDMRGMPSLDDRAGSSGQP